MTGRYATPLQVRMSEPERQALLETAQARGVPVSVLVRAALESLSDYRAAIKRASRARRAAVRAEAAEAEDGAA